MGCRLGARRGEIQRLLTLLTDEQQREAIEYDLIALGHRLDEVGTEALSWRDLWVIYQQAPPTSAIVLATYPEASIWQLQEHLLAGILDAVRVANWQRGRARRNEYPAPVPRPGIEPGGDDYIGSVSVKPVPMDEMADWLGWDDAMTPWRPKDTEPEAAK